MIFLYGLKVLSATLNWQNSFNFFRFFLDSEVNLALILHLKDENIRKPRKGVFFPENFFLIQEFFQFFEIFF